MSYRFQLLYLFLSFIFHERFGQEASEVIFTQVKAANIELAEIILQLSILLAKVNNDLVNLIKVG